MDINYKVTIRFPGGIKKKTKQYSIDKQTFPFLIMRLRSQYVRADIDWEGSDGSRGTTEIKTNK